MKIFSKKRRRYKKREERNTAGKAKEIKMVIWNIAGMTENKEDKLEYIKRFDIIGFVET